MRAIAGMARSYRGISTPPAGVGADPVREIHRGGTCHYRDTTERGARL